MNKTLLLFGVITISSMLSAETQQITIKSSSVKAGIVKLEADIEGKSVELICFVSEKSCTTLAPGNYLMLRPTNQGIYQDCQNIDVYNNNGHPAKDQPIGEYCLLGS